MISSNYLLDFLITFIMLLFGGLFIIHPPKKINQFYGYRTSSSMKSKETWKFAHKELGKLWFITGIISFILTLSFEILLPFDYNKTSLICLVINTILLVIPLPIIEILLNHKFDSKGREIIK